MFCYIAQWLKFAEASPSLFLIFKNIFIFYFRALQIKKKIVLQKVINTITPLYIASHYFLFFFALSKILVLLLTLTYLKYCFLRNFRYLTITKSVSFNR